MNDNDKLDTLEDVITMLDERGHRWSSDIVVTYQNLLDILESILEGYDSSGKLIDDLSEENIRVYKELTDIARDRDNLEESYQSLSETTKILEKTIDDLYTNLGS